MKPKYSNIVLIALYYSFVIQAQSILSLSSNSQELTKNLHYSRDGRSILVFIPGDGGSRMEARLDKMDNVHRFCANKSEWFDIWLDVRLLVPLLIDCLVDNMILTYDNVTHMSYNTPGVDIRPVSFGTVDSVEYLDRSRLPKTDYFAHIIDRLVKNNNYHRDIDMLAAPYDFRKGPHELGQFFDNLTKLIETSFIRNNCTKVSIICHSMGCLNSVYHLNNKSAKWKDKYIQRLISIAAPWSGSFMAIYAMLFGDKLGVTILDGRVVRKLQRTFPSLFYLFPRSPTFSSDELLIETINRNYTLKNIDELFEDIDNIPAKYMLRDTMAVAEKLKAPDVELWCLYSSGIDTANKVVSDDSLDKVSKSATLYGDGDGTVNLESLSSCNQWKKQQSRPVYTKEFKGVTHVGMLRSNDVANFISEQIIRST